MYTPVITDGSKRFGNNRWYSFSPKVKRKVYLFSDLKYEQWLLIEFNPKIVDFCEQPLKITNHINGKEKSSIPDMYIKYEEGKQEFREIKYSTELNKANIIDQIAIQRAWCNENGIEHSVRTEMEIRENRLRLSKLKLILKTIKQYDTPTDIEKYKIQKIINANLPQRISLQTLLQQSKLVTHRLYLTIGWMIINGEIKSNISHSYFGVNTEVWINE